MAAVNAALALFAIFAVAFAAEQGPAEKVVKMMAKLKSEVVKQGEKEDAEFKAFAKFCATNLNEKAYQLKRSEDKNASMTADKGVADDKIEEATQTIILLKSEVGTDEAALAKASADRAETAAKYAADAKEITDAMDALDKATAALSAAKKDTTALTSMSSMVSQILGTAGRISLLEVDEKQMSALASLGEPKTSLNFRPTEIVAMLKGLKATFTENKQRTDMEEEVAIGAFNKLRTNLNQQLKFKKEDLEEKIIFKNQKLVESAQFKKDIAAETAAHSADTEFKANLEADCNDKDAMDKSRQKAREDEMEAIQTAIDKLTAGGVSLSQVKSHAVAASAAKVGGLKLKKTGSVQVNKVSKAFVQLRSKRTSKHDVAMTKLRALAAKSGVAAAARLVEQAASANDPFVEVRKLFTGLLNRMTDQAKEEASTNSNCKENVATHAKERDETQAMKESLTNEITGLDSKLFKLNKDVKGLTEDISEATAALEEASKQRADEHETYLSALKEASDGVQGSSLALQILTDYYKKEGGSSLLQSASDSKQPEVNMGDYAAEAHERSAGVLGMLEVLKSDFESTKAKVEADEQSAVSDFEELETSLNTDITEKSDDIDTKKGEIKDTTVTKGSEEQSLEAAKDRLELALEKLDAMRGMCTENEESFESRTQKRQEEIDHLKNTVSLLDELIAQGH